MPTKKIIALGYPISKIVVTGPIQDTAAFYFNILCTAGMIPKAAKTKKKGTLIMADVANETLGPSFGNHELQTPAMVRTLSRPATSKIIQQAMGTYYILVIAETQACRRCCNNILRSGGGVGYDSV